MHAGGVSPPFAAAAALPCRKIGLARSYVPCMKEKKRGKKGGYDITCARLVLFAACSSGGGGEGEREGFIA